MARFRAKSKQPKICQRLLPERQGQNLALTVLYVPHSFDSGWQREHLTRTFTRKLGPESGPDYLHVPSSLDITKPKPESQHQTPKPNLNTKPQTRISGSFFPLWRRRGLGVLPSWQAWQAIGC